LNFQVSQIRFRQT